MRDAIKAKIEENIANGRYVRLSKEVMSDLDRLRTAYGMKTYFQVIKYLVQQGCAGLGATDQAATPEAGA